MLYTYYCMQQFKSVYRCSAKAIVAKSEDGGFFLYSCDSNHNHLFNEYEIKADRYRLQMTEQVRNDPTLPVGEAIRDVKLKIAKELTAEELTGVIDALGNNHALEQRLLEARVARIGPTPKNRSEFNVTTFINKGFVSEDMIILDSDDLPDDWKSDTEDQNVSNKYNWEKLDEAMLEQEEDEDDSEKDENIMRMKITIQK